MAKRLDQFEFPHKGGRRYPWDDWLNGQIWELVRGIDFDVQVKSMQITATCQARRQGLHVRTSGRENKFLVIQAYERTIDTESQEGKGN